MLYDNSYTGIDDDGFLSYNQNAFAYLRHINIHETLGLMQTEFKLDTDEFAGDTEVGYIAVDSTGNVLTFSQISGKIYKRSGTSNEVIATNPNGKHKGAFYYNGIYFFVAENGQLGWMRGTDVGTIKYSHGTIGSIRLEHVPIYAWYTKVYVGGSDNVYVMDVEVSDGNVTPQGLIKTALNLPYTWAVTDFRDLDRDLIWGAFADNEGAIGQYRRFSDSFHQVDRTDGVVNTFFGSSNSNVIFGQMGHNGDIVHYTGAQAVLRKRIPDVATKPNPYADAVIDGRAMLAIGGRIYSYHQRKSGHPFGLTHAFTCTGGDSAEIVSIAEQENSTGRDQLFVSWKKGSEYGFDSIDYTTRADGLIVTPIAEWFQESSHDERNAKIFVEPKNGYRAHYHYMPKNTSIEIKTAVNNAVHKRSPKECKTIHDKGRMLYHTKLSDISIGGGCKTRLTQGYIYLNSSGEDSPLIRSIELY